MTTQASPYRVIRRDEQGRIFAEDTSMPEGSQFRFCRFGDDASLERAAAARVRLRVILAALAA